MTRATSLLALPSSLLTKSSMSCQDISWARIALLPGHPWHEERREGNSTWEGGGEGGGERRERGEGRRQHQLELRLGEELEGETGELLEDRRLEEGEWWCGQEGKR